MASPEWFFSTLAQSSAAIAGLVIAFSAVLYQLERQRREKRTDELREVLIDFQDEHHRQIKAYQLGFSKLLNVESKDRYDYITDNYSPIDQEREDVVQSLSSDNRIDHPKICYIWLNLFTIEDVLTNIQPSSDRSSHYLLSLEQFETLDDSIGELYYFFTTPDALSKIMDEFEEIFPGIDITKNVVQISAPYQDAILNAETTENHEIENDGGNDGVVFVSIQDINQYVASLNLDFQTAYAKKGRTILYPSQTVTGIVKISGILVMTGVFLPMVFLFTLPQTVSEITAGAWALLATQTLLLILNVVITGYLLFLVYQNLGTATDRS